MDNRSKRIGFKARRHRTKTFTDSFERILASNDNYALKSKVEESTNPISKEKIMDNRSKKIGFKITRHRTKTFRDSFGRILASNDNITR